MNIVLGLCLFAVIAAFLLAPRFVALGFRARVRRELIAVFREVVPEIHVARETEEFLELSAPNMNGARMNLGKLYKAIADLRPDNFESRRIVYEHFAAPLCEVGDTGDVSLATHGARVLPRLIGEDFLQEINSDLAGHAAPEMPLRALGFTGLSVAYVLDSEHHVAYVTRAVAGDLGLDDFALHNLALENLRRKWKLETISDALEGKAISVVQSCDDHDAARLLLVPECLQEGQILVAFVPDKSTLILAPPPADGDWSALSPICGAALCERPLRVSRDGISPVSL